MTKPIDEPANQPNREEPDEFGGMSECQHIFSKVAEFRWHPMQGSIELVTLQQADTCRECGAQRWKDITDALGNVPVVRNENA